MKRNFVLAGHSQIAPAVSISDDCSIIADEVILEDDVQIGSNVEITCDRLVIRKGTKIGPNTKITSPSIVLEEGCVLSGSLEAEFNEYFHVGRLSLIGKDCVFSGQGFKSGELLVLRDHVVIGGGGSKSPNSYLTMGDQVVIIDHCYINLSERIEIGSATALSRGVSLLTHAAWQPALMGFGSNFAPIKVGEYAVIYLNASVMPGVTIGNYTTIGAHSVVTQNIPDYCFAAGVPAVVKRGPQGYPTPMSLEEKYRFVEEVMEDYIKTLPGKGFQISTNTIRDDGSFTVKKDDQETRFTLLQSDRIPTAKSQVTIALETVATDWIGDYHIDLNQMRVSGESSPVAEDFRDYLRRRAIRIGSTEQFRTLPLSNLDRLKKKRRKAELSK
jgi:acetyltransferase-like isoleucine patch superfamily enzyme